MFKEAWIVGASGPDHGRASRLVEFGVELRTFQSWASVGRAASLPVLAIGLFDCSTVARGSAEAGDGASVGDVVAATDVVAAADSLYDAFADAPSPSDSDAAASADLGDEAAKTTATVHGVVLDDAGKGLPGTAVLCCSRLNCLYGTTGFGGRFTIAHVPVGERLVKVTEVDDTSPRHAELVAPIRAVAGEDLDVGTLDVPTLPTGADLAPALDTPQTVDVGDGLVLTLTPSSLKAPLGTTTKNIAARRVAPEHVPPTLVVPGETLLAVYALYPFGMVSETPIDVTLPASGPAGPVHVSVIHEVEAVLTTPVEATSDGESVSGGAITRLTWLVVSRPVGR